MKSSWNLCLFAFLTSIAVIVSTAHAGRFGGGGARMGGGGFHGGGMARPSGGYGGGGFARSPIARPTSAMRSAALPSRPAAGSPIHGPYGGGVGGNRPLSAGTRPGATRPGQGGAGERHVWETPRGGTVVAGGNRGPIGGRGAYAYSGPHGAVAIGGGRGGSITGPGGREFAGGSSGHVVMGPNGNVNAGRSRGAAVVGPGGRAIAGGSHAGATVGSGGEEIHGSRGGIASGPGGTIAGGSRGAVAVGPHGAVAGGGRYVAGRGVYGAGAAGTRFVVASDLRGQGAYVRNSFRAYGSFTPGWYTNHPGAWFAAGWAAGAVWNACTWGECAGYFGYPADASAVYYNYGDNVTYQDGRVYYDGESYATEEEYADQATEIAAQGQTSQPGADEKWQPLGIFALIKGDETSSNDIFQLALNADGILRGNYYNAVTDATTPVSGSLDKAGQRVAWAIDGAASTVYETGLYNLTQDETTMLVHFGKNRTEQYKLFRVQQDTATEAQ